MYSISRPSGELCSKNTYKDSCEYCEASASSEAELPLFDKDEKYLRFYSKGGCFKVREVMRNNQYHIGVIIHFDTLKHSLMY